MKRCKLIFGMYVIFIFTSFHTAFVHGDVLTDVQQIKEYLKYEMPAFFEKQQNKDRSIEEELMKVPAPSTATIDLIQDVDESLDNYGNSVNTSSSGSNVFTNNELLDPISNIEYLANGYVQTLSKWNILGSLWYVKLPDSLSDTKSTPDMSPDQIANTHLGRFCDKGKGKGKCKNKNNKSLYYTDVNIGKFLSKYITTDEFEFITAMINVVDPLPSPVYRNKMLGIIGDPFQNFQNISNIPPPPGSPKAKELAEQKASELNKQIEDFKKHLAQTATLSTAYHSLHQMYKVRKQLLLTGKDGIQKVTSILKIIENEANRRFLNKEWQKDIDKAPTPALLRELANINAFLAKMEAEQYKQRERIELLLAAQISGGSQVVQAVDKMFGDDAGMNKTASEGK